MYQLFFHCFEWASERRKVAGCGIASATARRTCDGTAAHTVDNALISAMSDVLGSLVGGSATVATTWVTQRTLGKRELLRMEIKRSFRAKQVTSR
jgi:hypothetical protein